MNIKMKDEDDEEVFIRTFTGHGGGVEFEGVDIYNEEVTVSVRRRDLPTLIYFLQAAIKELDNGNNNS